MVVSPLWRGPGTVPDFILDGKSYRQGYATAQTPTVTAVSGVRITTLLLRTCNLTTIACGRWSLVTIQGEVARRSCLAFEFLALCLNNNNNNHTQSRPGTPLRIVSLRLRTMVTGLSESLKCTCTGPLSVKCLHPRRG